jgi:plasmid stabilization system protein ParE
LSRRIVIGATAKRQVRSAVTWWRRERPLVPTALSKELRDAFELLEGHPLSGQLVDDAAFPNARRLSLKRTHYYLYYEVRDHAIRIVGLRHQSRGPVDPESE